MGDMHSHGMSLTKIYRELRAGWSSGSRTHRNGHVHDPDGMPEHAHHDRQGRFEDGRFNNHSPLHARDMLRGMRMTTRDSDPQQAVPISGPPSRKEGSHLWMRDTGLPFGLRGPSLVLTTPPSDPVEKGR